MNQTESIKTDLLRDISDAQMVLVGLGEEFDEAAVSEELAIARGLLSEEGLAWMLPLLSDASLDLQTTEKKRKALQNLSSLLEGKNYFVISKAQTTLIETTPWREGRLVMTLGTMRKKQCRDACEHSGVAAVSEEEVKQIKEAAVFFLHEISQNDRPDATLAGLPEEVRIAMEMIQKREKIKSAAQSFTDRIHEILGDCDCCGMPNALNLYAQGIVRYDERGYLKDWEKYVKWLGGSMNRNLLLLELGCSADTPEIIRGPFEKIAELNLKSNYYRIGAGATDDKKIVEIRENVIDWLSKL